MKVRALNVSVEIGTVCRLIFECDVMFVCWLDILEYSTYVHYDYIHWAAGRNVRTALVLMTVMKSVGYAIHVNCIEDMRTN
jgi:hypothetical protein